MNTKLTNRLDAFKSILTLQNRYGPVIAADALLKNWFSTLKTRVEAIDKLLIEMANSRTPAFVKVKNRFREEAAVIGSRLGTSLYLFALETKDAFLQAESMAWRSRSALTSGNREAVIANMGALLIKLNETKSAIIPTYATAAELADFDEKYDRFKNALEGRSDAFVHQVELTTGFERAISEVSTIVNDRISQQVKTLADEHPEFFNAYQIARKVRHTIPADGGAQPHPIEETLAKSTQKSPIKTSRKKGNLENPLPTITPEVTVGVHPMNGASQ